MRYLFLVLASCSMVSQAEFNLPTLISGPAGTNWSAASGTQVQIPLPGRVVYEPATKAYNIHSPYISHFIIRMDPASVQKGCRASAGNVLSNENATLSVESVIERPSTDMQRPGWFNFEFSVNKGAGAYTLAVQPLIAAADAAATCVFDVMTKAEASTANAALTVVAEAPKAPVAETQKPPVPEAPKAGIKN